MKKPLLIIILIALVALGAGGVALFWEVIQTAASAFLSMFVSILPFLDMEQKILCKVATILIVQALCGLGFIISWKTEKKIGHVISALIDVIATMLLVIA